MAMTSLTLSQGHVWPAKYSPFDLHVACVDQLRRKDMRGPARSILAEGLEATLKAALRAGPLPQHPPNADGSPRAVNAKSSQVPLDLVACRWESDSGRGVHESSCIHPIHLADRLSRTRQPGDSMLRSC